MQVFFGGGGFPCIVGRWENLSLAMPSRSRIYKINRISKIIGARDRSSGSPGPERRMERRTSPWPVARGPVPRDRTRTPETSRIYKIHKISKIIGAGDCSSGAPAPERRMERRTSPWPVARGPVPRDRTRTPETSRIYKIHKISKIIGAGDCSSGAPAPERRMERRTSPWPVARGPVPRDRSTCAKNARRPKPFSQPRHGEGQALALRLTETALQTVARGPVPRERTRENISSETLRRCLSVGQERLLLIRFGSGCSRTTDVGRSGDRGGQAPALRWMKKTRGTGPRATVTETPL